MLNRSAILSAAWKSYQLARPCFFASGDQTGQRRFLRDLFGKMLRTAWDDAKRDARFASADAIAAQLVAAQTRVAADRLAALTPAARSLRTSQVRDELATLDYAPFAVRTSQRRANLAAELNALGAAN